jgi:DNA polymerase-3 subunit epsilon
MAGSSGGFLDMTPPLIATDPERDVSASDFHGITASDLRDAPTFADLIGDIWHRFEGSIPVSHNFSFDKRFLCSEFTRAGVNIEDFGGLCTMRLANEYGLTRGRLQLAALCCDLGIPLRPAHSAGNDAWMSAEILKLAAENNDLTKKARPVSCRELWKHPATPLGITRQKARDTPIRSPLQLVSERINSISLGASVDDGKLYAM